MKYNMRRTVSLYLLVFLSIFVLAACAGKQHPNGQIEATDTNQTTSAGKSETADSTDVIDPSKSNDGADSDNSHMESNSEALDIEQADGLSSASDGICVAIDPGHQLKGNYSQEAVGPGATQTKAKVSSGTTGRWSGLAEYELNLQVSLLLRDELEDRGYRVVMTRTSNEVDLSNIERAQIAEAADADIFVRIHANGSDDPSSSGALTICMTKNNPYCAHLYNESRRLSDDVLNGLAAATGAKKRSVWETDTMSGINWAKMPVTIVEMGFMTNEREDKMMATVDYQRKLAVGIANGIDNYFGLDNSVKNIETDNTEQSAQQARELQTLIDGFVQGKNELWDVWVEDLTTGATASACSGSQEERGFISASIIKIFIAGAVYESIEDGRINHDNVISDIKLMLQKSDNEATNRLTKMLGDGDAEKGMERVTGFAESIGCTNTKHNRLMMDFNGKENYTTTEDCATALRMIYRGEYVSSAWSEEMLAIMKGQVDHSRIHRYLPKGTVVADKPGALYEHSNGDVGIVFSPGGDYIICMICNSFQSVDVVKDNMARLSLEIYNRIQNR